MEKAKKSMNVLVLMVERILNDVWLEVLMLWKQRKNKHDKDRFLLRGIVELGWRYSTCM